MASAAPSAGSWPKVVRDPAFREKIKSAKVLCVGAGGIGCELLKTLVCTGFEQITVIDLDTIETSNLNRQFLFRRHHVGESKAKTAASVITSIKPQAHIEAHHANVKEPQFGVDFIRGFDLILNGLDNLEARRHVNQLAMATGVPLVESGTAGYLGQVTVHLKGETECFDCHPKPVPKSFPICTLRNTPDKPIHCIVWAKDLLFTRLFGKQDQVTDLDEQSAAADAAAAAARGEVDADEVAAQAAATVAAAQEEASAFVRRDGESAQQYAVRVFNRLYKDDIERLQGMTDLWKSRPAPTPLDISHILPGSESDLTAALTPSAATGDSGQVSACKELGLNDPKQKWSLKDTVRVFLRTVMDYHTHRQEELGSATFDKDDDLAVEFVTAANNLRSHCYGIPPQTLFDAKGMAGNIIHAIATTNAIISGLIVAEALKLLTGCREACSATYLSEAAVGNRRLLMANKPGKPTAGCSICSRNVLTVRCNAQTTTLQRLIDEVIKGRMGVEHPSLMCGGLLYEEDPDMDEDEVEENARHLPKVLSQLPDGGLQPGKLLRVSDNSRQFAVDVILAHQDDDTLVLEGKIPEATALPPPEATPPAATTTQPPSTTATAASDDDDIIMLDSDEPPTAVTANGGKKRAAGSDGAEDGASKKRKGRDQGGGGSGESEDGNKENGGGAGAGAGAGAGGVGSGAGVKKARTSGGESAGAAAGGPKGEHVVLSDDVEVIEID